MVIYKCPTCLKEFDRKCNFIDHTEKKKIPCRPIINIETPIEPVKSQKYLCLYCNFNFSTSSHLSRHLNQGRCKIKKELDMEKEKMFKLLLTQKENEHEKQMHKKDDEIKELKYLIREQNEKITDLIKKIKPSSITNNNTLNNIIVQPNINKFGHENIEKIINPSIFVNKVLMNTGSTCLLECVNQIYNNPKCPENQTVYCSDINREKMMVSNGKDWDLQNKIFVLTEVQNKLQEYIDMHEGELEDRLKKDQKFKEKFESRLKIYYNRYFSKDAKYIDLVDDKIIHFFYQIKESVKQNYQILYNNAIEFEKQKMLNNDYNNNFDLDVNNIEIDIKEIVTIPIKKRGRPKKVV
jgi:hypothetical protein